MRSNGVHRAEADSLAHGQSTAPVNDYPSENVLGHAIMDVVVWLRSLGLGKYEAAFRENEIDETVLPSLTEEHLKQLGVTALGHRVSPSLCLVTREPSLELIQI
jgi:SAM domain (Sterile alpha motif)